MKANQKSASLAQCQNCAAKDLEIFGLQRKISQLQTQIIEANDKLIAFYQNQPIKTQMKVVFKR